VRPPGLLPVRSDLVLLCDLIVTPVKESKGITRDLPSAGRPTVNWQAGISSACGDPIPDLREVTDSNVTLLLLTGPATKAAPTSGGVVLPSTDTYSYFHRTKIFLTTELLMYSVTVKSE
jgi:hypothetical protein